MKSLLDDLNPPQREAVLQTEGPILILAGAGSGKTRVITRRIAHILNEGLAEPNQILAVTFTNRAAEEMRERVAVLVGTARAKRTVLSTFHAFCVRVLRAEVQRLGLRKNFTISTESDSRTLLRRVVGDIDGPGESFSTAMLRERIGMLKATHLDFTPTGADPTGNATKDKYVKWMPEIYERYQSALRAANSVDFDDLLLLTAKLWRDHPATLARYQKHFRYVMVDEYQDTNRVQYELLCQLVAKHRNLCVVGDDDQAIYGWRGADIQNILSFEREYAEAKIIKLEQNYRSTKSILSAANYVIQNNVERREKKLWSDLAEGRALDWFITGDEESEAGAAVNWLRHIQKKSQATFGDFAVLYRSNLQSRPFEIAFRQAGIPYVVIGGPDFFERSEVKDIICYLRALANPNDETAILRVINVPRRGVGDATLHLVHEICRYEDCPFMKGLKLALDRGSIKGSAEQGVRQFLGLVRDLSQHVRKRDLSLTELTQNLVRDIGYRDDLFRSTKSAAQFESRWQNVEAVINAVHAYEGAVDTPTLTGFLDDSSLNTDEDRRTKKRAMDNAVRLLTVHSAKGLEFPFVFIAGVEDGLMPHERSLRDGTLEEERRLFYVALTRGQRHVTLFETLGRTRNGRTKPTKTSRFLREIPEELLKKRVLAVSDGMTKGDDEPPPPPKPKKAEKRGNR